MKITYKEYKDALDIVLQFQRQILDADEKVQNKQGTILLAVYLKSLNEIKYHNAIKKWWRWRDIITFDDCTVEYYLQLLSKKTEPRRWFRGIGEESLNNLFKLFIKDFTEAEFLKHELI